MTIPQLFSLSGQTALVTGGATGLGHQMATALAEAGANVVVASRNMERLERVADELRAVGGRPMAIGLDVTQPEQIEQAVDRVVGEYGRLDILVNNSAATDVTRPFEPLTLEKWEAVLKVNLTGALLCAQAAFVPMKAAGRGKIINIASIYGLVGIDGSLYGGTPERPLANYAYTAGKGALVNLTRDLAVSWAPYGIHVNAICPGMFPVEANMKRWPEGTFENLRRRIPLGRMGNSTDLKGAVVYLASAASDYVTGHNLVVDGGWVAW